MPADFTVAGGIRLLSSFTGTGAVAAQNMYMMLLKSGWDTSISSPRTNGTSATWLAHEANFDGYARILAVGTPDKFGTPANIGTAVVLLNDQVITWSSTGATNTNVITGAALVNSGPAAQTSIGSIYAFTSFDISQTIGSASGQSVTVPASEFFLQVG
jgi:hypothetical protein